MKRAVDIIHRVAQQTDRAILFHSASGKDSIALLDLLSPRFKEVVCVYLYVVKDLSHINRYINYAIGRYKNVKFIQLPHFAKISYHRVGYMGCKKIEGLKKISMADLTEMAREKTGIEWAFFGFKQSDSMNRRLMLRTYEECAINGAQKKCYPLSSYKNKDILEYINLKNLVKPESYGKGQSAGTNITDLDYLLFLRKNFPVDLKTVIRVYPLVERILFEHDYENTHTK